MKKTVLFLLAVLTFSVQCAISGDNPLWMVVSKDALTSYAISQVGQGSAQFWAPTSVEGEEYTNSVYCDLPQGERRDAFKVLDLLKQKQLRFSVARPDVDQINSYIGLYNDDGWCMFYGWGYGKLLMDEMGNWFSPQSLLKFDSYLNWQIPILKDVSQAEVVLRDENGNVVRTEWLSVDDNGRLIFNRDFVGQNGEILVRMRDGSSIVASLQDNKVYEITAVSAKIDSSIDGVILFDTDASSLVVNPTSHEGYGDSPLVRGTFTQAQTFTLSVKTTEGEVPFGIWYRNVETSSVGEWRFVSIGVGAGEMTIFFVDTPGTYEFRFGWEFFGPCPVDYYDDGGKG